MRRIAFALSVFFSVFFFSTQAHARNIVQEMVDMINQTRYANGLGQVWFDDVLGNAAGAHARDMAQRNYLSHDTPEGWSAHFRARGWGWPDFLPFGEIIGSASEPGQMLQQWLNSPMHRGQILDGRYRQIGIGHFYNEYSGLKNYWCVQFGAR